MTKSKKTLEDLNKKYGIGGKNKSTSTTSTKSEKGKQSNSSAPTLEELNKKYGIGETTTPKPIQKNTSVKNTTPTNPKNNTTNKPTDHSSMIVQPQNNSPYGMTMAEYNMRRSSNPSMPEYGSYDYYKSREESLRPIMEEISQDFDRQNPTYKAWVENYEAGLMPDDVNPYTKEKVINLSKKFKYQNSIIAEYEDINAQLQKFDKKGIHYTESGEIDTKSGAEESKYARERYANILSADALTTLEMAQGFRGELPTDKQNEYNQKEAMANIGLIEGQKEEAYNYYEKNKNNTYEDSLGGRFAGNYKVGRIGIKSNQAGYTSFYATSDDIEASEVYQALGERIQNRNKATFKNNGATDEIISIIGQYAPQGLDQIVVGTIGKVVGGLVGSKSAGKALATASYMYEQTAGATYVRLLQESNLSVEDAKKLASSEALASSIIEFGLDFATSKLWSKVGSSSIASNGISGIGDKLTKALISIGVSEKGVKTILNVAKNTGKLVLHSMGEGSEEWWQEGVSITADKYAKEGETASPFKMLLQSLWLPQYSKDDLGRMNKSFLGGMVIGFGQGGVDALSSYGMNKAMSSLDNRLQATEQPTTKVTTTPGINIQTRNTFEEQPDTLEQAARDVVAERNKKSGTPLSERLEALSHNNEPIAIEDVKKASGFGDSGAKLLTEIASEDGMTFIKARDEMKVAYFSGYAGEDITFTNDLQNRAKLAGIDDRIAANNIAKENAKKATIYKGTFTENEYTKNWSDATKKMVSTVAKHFGMDISAVDRIIASVVNGKTYEANAEHQDGKMRISSTAEKFIHALVLHESGHRMEQMATDEWNELANFLYKRAERLGRRAKLGFSRGMRFDDVKAEHDNAGLTKTTSDYINEIAVRELETIFSSAEEFNNFIAEIESNPQAKTGFQKIMDFIAELIEEIKRVFAGMSKAERAEARESIKELERIKELYAKAYLATKDAVAESRKTQSQGVAENATTTEGNVDFSLKNKNLSIFSRIPYVVLNDYTSVAKNDYSALGTLEAKVENIQKGTYKNDATGYSADINSETINKAIYPTHKRFNRFKDTYIHNLNAMTMLPELFKNAVYVDSKNPQKAKNQNKAIKEYHHFVAPIFMDNGEYRALITAREKLKSNTLYVLRVEVLPIQKRHTLLATQQNAGGSQWLSVPSDISIPELVKDVKIKNYDTNIADTYTGADIQFSLKEKAPTFYSQMGKTIADMKQEKIGANSVVSYLTGRGVKAEEIKWSGIETFLEGKKSVTKAELQEFVANNQLQIETETRLSDYTIKYTEDESKSLDEISKVTNEIWQNIDNLWEQKYGSEIAWDIRYNDNAVSAMYREVNKLQRSDTESGAFFNDIIRSLNRIDVLERNQNTIIERAKARTLGEKSNTATKWDEYKLDGGENYRELLFKLPDSTYSNYSMQTHWGDTESVLAHARIQDFYVDGQKMLFIEEIQSDWHNAGQRYGYRQKGQKTESDIIRADNDAYEEFWNSHIIQVISDKLRGVGYENAPTIVANLWEGNTTSTYAFLERLGIALTNDEKGYIEEQVYQSKERNQELKSAANDNSAPNAPFKSNYHEYVLKNLIRMAAEEGYDIIGWTTADIQSDRWSEDYAEGYRIEYDQDIPKFLNKYGKKWGAKVGTSKIKGTEVWSMPITDSMKESVLYEGQPQYSLKDQDYLKAVESGDMETAQRMVDEAAEKAFANSKVRGNDGKLKTVYHGRVSDFNIFDRSFASIEGDFGKGYYFTSNEYDVDANYANEEGPDLKNKIARLAERLEWEDEYADLSYGEREEIARQRLVTSEPSVVTAYLNMENPVYITPDENGTLLDYNEEYDEEYDEYGEPEGLLIDFVEALNSIASDYAYNDVDFSFLYEYAYDNGGVYASDAVKTIKHRITDELTDENGDLAVNEVIRLAFEEIGFDGIIDTSVYYKFRNMNGMDSGTTHYIVFNSEQIKSDEPVTYDDKDKVIPLSERFNKQSNDIRYSLKDSEGKTLTEAQREYFKDSKIRDENGNLLVMYQGASEDFTVFDRRKSSYANLYGRGFYFTKSERHASQYGNTRAYYLNIKHPVSTTETTITKSQLRKFLQAVIENEDYSFENYGYGATVDSVLQSTYGKSDFLMLNDVSQTAIGDLVEAVELFNEINGTDYDGIILDTETVTFNSEQAKLTTNKKPTNNPDINFSLKKAVEETKNLIAVHNLWEEKLQKTLKLGGLPMPSIAIVRAKEGHDKFGNISLVFRKETISPTDRRNKVYSGDAYTPTYPHIEYKLNTAAQERIEKKINNLVPRDVQKALGGLYLDSYNMEEALNRSEDLASSYKYNFAMKYAFLLDSGVGIELPMKDAPLSSGGRRSDEAIIKVAETVPEEVLRNAIEGENQYKSEPAIRKAVSEAVQEKYKDKPEVAKALMPKYEEELSLGQLMGYAEDAIRYKEEGVKQEVDYKEASNLISEKTDTEKYEEWLKDLFSDVIAKEGIRNDKDLFTPSGNRRSFEALHYEHTLENVVRAMKERGTIGIGGFGGNNIFGSSAVEYNTISEIKEKANERMRTITEEEYDNIRQGFTDRFFELAGSLPIHKDSFSAIDDAANMLCEAVMKYKTKSGMANYLRNESKGWANYSDHIVDDLVELVNDIRNMPANYFEAKPQRAVGFNEIAMAIIPDNVSEELKRTLAENNIPFVEYEHGNNSARLEALNSLENVQFSLKGVSETSTKDRKELLDIIEHLKGEFEVTKFAKADPKKLAKMTRDILKEYNSKADYDETYKEIDALYQYMANGEDGHTAVWEDVYSRAYNVAQKIVENALVVDDYMYQTYKSLREYLRSTPIKFDSRHDSVPSSYENYNEFRKMNMGRLKFTNNGMSIDYIYQELAHLYPEFFNAEEQVTSEEQFETIIDVLDQIQPTEINPFDRQIEQVSMQLANDLTSRFFDIPQAKPTFADKAERRVVEAHINGGKKVEAVRQQKNERIKKLLEAQKEKTKKQLDKIREQRDTKVEKEKAKRRDAISKMSETQKAKVLRARITRHASDLSKKLVNPTDNQHIPYELQGVVAKLLDCINLESNYTYDTESHSYKKNDEGLPSKRTQAFYELRDIYKNIASSVVVDPDLVVEGGLLSSVISLADKRIVDMDSSELETVWQTMRAIEASISSANKMFSQGKFATILEYAENLRVDNVGKKEKTELKGVLGKGKKLASLDMLTPETYFHYLGSAGDSIFRMMRDAQDKHISIMKEVADFTHKTLKDVDVNSLEKTIHTVKLGGEDVNLTTAQLMELYVLMKREQAVDHIMIGGILPDITKGKGLKLNTKAEPIRNLTIADITRALSKLTDEQKKIADKLQNFVSTVLSKYGNEASMKVYNYEKFLEKNYWTIRTNKQEIQSEIGKDTSVTSVANKGMAKGTVPHANTSVRIGSIFDTFASHSSDMATYAAWLGTSEDVNRIRNFVFWDNGTRTGTVKGILDTVHGIHGSDYLQKLLTDVAIGVKGTDNMNPFDKLIGHYKAASVGANLRVIIQQPTAILRAMDMIDAHYLAEGAVRPHKGWEKAKKYAPIAQWKDWGHFDINTGRQMKDVLFDNASLLEKTKQVGMWGASMADSLAWGQLWNAVEAETKAKHKELEVGSDAYYETVAKRFTEIVDHTQVVDGILQRSQIMRSPDALTKMATSFMGEPTKQYNMAVSAAYDAINGKGDTRKKAVARLGRTAMSLAVAGIVNACAQSIIDAMRDDDKEKDYWEKWLTAFVGDGEETKFINSNVADTINPLNYVPFAKDIVSIMQGYDVKRMDTESITKTFNAVTNMYKAVTGTGKYTIAEASAQLFAETARLFGLPVANVKRDVKSLVMSMANATDSYLMQYRMEKAMLDINYAGNSKNFMDILFNAYNNDREAYEYIYNDLLKSGYDAEKIQSGMETRMKKAEGVEKASDLSKRYMTPDDEKKYDSSLNRVKSSQAWKSANAEQRKDAEDSLYDFLTSTSEAMEKTRAEARAFGVDETEYTLWQLAKEMVNDSKDSMNAKEKAAAIEMLDLGNSELAYFYNTETADKAYAGGVDIENFAMFKAAVSGLKGDDKKAKVNSYANKYASNNKEYLFFMGSEYSSYKKRSDYIKYFGK